MMMVTSGGVVIGLASAASAGSLLAVIDGGTGDAPTAVVFGQARSSGMWGNADFSQTTQIYWPHFIMETLPFFLMSLPVTHQSPTTGHNAGPNGTFN